MGKVNEYHPGKLWAFTQLVASVIKKNPMLLDNAEALKQVVRMSLPIEMRDKSKCANCDASMVEYVYIFDSWDALLLLRMADVVKHKRMKGLDFTMANQVRVPELDASHAVKCRTTQTAKLGLIAQLRTKEKKRVGGVWVITRRGFEALAGKPVPKKVKVWRKKIEQHYDETITISEALKSHVDYVEKSLKRGRQVKEDHRDIVNAYNSAQWYEWSIHEGALV